MASFVYVRYDTTLIPTLVVAFLDSISFHQRRDEAMALGDVPMTARREGRIMR